MGGVRYWRGGGGTSAIQKGGERPYEVSDLGLTLTLARGNAQLQKKTHPHEGRRVALLLVIFDHLVPGRATDVLLEDNRRPVAPHPGEHAPEGLTKKERDV